MSMPSANMLLDEVMRGIAVSAVFRAVFERKPVFSQGTINQGLKFAGANVVYSVARPLITQAVPQVGQLLPNGSK